MFLSRLLDTAALYYPEKTAIWSSEGNLTFLELLRLVNRLSRSLRDLGLKEGDRVALSLPNTPEFVACYYAILKNGATVVPVDTALRAPEIRHILKNSNASMLILGEASRGETVKVLPEVNLSRIVFIGDNPEGWTTYGALAQGPDLDYDPPVGLGDDLAVIFYTSGTTGLPKGVAVSHSNINSKLGALSEAISLTPGDRLLCTVPLCHVFGQIVVMNTGFWRGAGIILVQDPGPAEVLGAVSEHRATVMFGGPTLYAGLLSHPQPKSFDTTSLRLAVTGGGTMYAETAREFYSKFPGVTLQDAYGLTETTATVICQPLDRPWRPGSVGLPLRGSQVKIVDENGDELPPGQIGEICLRDPGVMKGYLDDPEATALVLRNGWLWTGDIGYQDVLGWVFIVDRKKDLVHRAGYNVSPSEVEEVLLGHPAILDAAVVGVPDPQAGEHIRAFIVLKPGARVTHDAILGYCRENLAYYKCPHTVHFVASLPKGPTGKVLRRELKRLPA